jgi:glycoprotein 6-alpha-L-fucosyltransferase
MQPDTAKMLQEVEKNLEFAKPIVGIHVRRTDKINTEAAYHSVAEYMKYVSLIRYFQTKVKSKFNLIQKSLQILSFFSL